MKNIFLWQEFGKEQFISTIIPFYLLIFEKLNSFVSRKIYLPPSLTQWDYKRWTLQRQKRLFFLPLRKPHVNYAQHREISLNSIPVKRSSKFISSLVWHVKNKTEENFNLQSFCSYWISRGQKLLIHIK